MLNVYLNPGVFGQEAALRRIPLFPLPSFLPSAIPRPSLARSCIRRFSSSDSDRPTAPLCQLALEVVLPLFLASLSSACSGIEHLIQQRESCDLHSYLSSYLETDKNSTSALLPSLLFWISTLPNSVARRLVTSVITLEKVVSEVTAVGKTKRKLIGGTATRLRTIVVVAAHFPVLMWEQISDYYHCVTWLLLLGGSVENQDLRMRDTDELHPRHVGVFRSSYDCATKCDRRRKLPCHFGPCPDLLIHKSHVVGIDNNSARM